MVTGPSHMLILCTRHFYQYRTAFFLNASSDPIFFLKFDLTLTANNSPLKSRTPKKYHIFGILRTSAFAWWYPGWHIQGASKKVGLVENRLWQILMLIVRNPEAILDKSILSVLIICFGYVHIGKLFFGSWQTYLIGKTSMCYH